MYDNTVTEQSQPRAPRKQVPKLTFSLSGQQDVTIRGEANTLDQVISTTENLLSRLKQAKKLGLRLETFCAMLRDQSQAENGT